MKRAVNIINSYIRNLKKYRMQEGLEMAIKKYDWGIALLENIKKECVIAKKEKKK